MNNRHASHWQTPVGWIALAGGSSGIEEIFLSLDAGVVCRAVEGRSLRSAVLLTARRQIDEYFAGERHFFDLPLVCPALSTFATHILHSLRKVPFGTTISYGELARVSGYPHAARAVGGVMARNPFPLVIPCHRVIGVGGRMTGYSGGAGIASKEWLLRFEAGLQRKEILL